jgi:hypothetical protein
MFESESVERCSECGESTPHSRRRIALPKLVATAAILWAAWCVWLGRGGYLGPGMLLAVGLFVVLQDRESFWHVHCVRCRTKKQAELRKTKPTLDGTTEINIV